jgi:hypothetical protein
MSRRPFRVAGALQLEEDEEEEVEVEAEVVVEVEVEVLVEVEEEVVVEVEAEVEGRYGGIVSAQVVATESRTTRSTTFATEEVFAQLLELLGPLSLKPWQHRCQLGTGFVFRGRRNFSDNNNWVPAVGPRVGGQTKLKIGCVSK